MAIKWKKLYKRLLTGILFVIIVLFLLLFNSLSLHVFLWLVAFLCGYEYLMIRTKNESNKILLAFLSILIGVLLSVLNYFGLISFKPVLPVIVLSVIYQLYLVARLYVTIEYASSFWSILFSAFLCIGLPVLLLNQYMIDTGNKYILLGVILVVWASDTFAYLAGSLFGRHKIFPSVSPKKTVEGAIGGAVFAIIVGIIIFYVWPQGNMLFHIGLAFIIWLAGMYGDFVESRLKRNFELKDSGDILPGHGGFLDRFDSFIFLIPFVLLYFELFA